MDKSLFHRVPAELRNRSYALLMPEPQSITVGLRHRRYGYAREAGYADISSLARTCKDVYDENMSTYYASNHWKLILEPFYAGAGSVVSIPPTLRSRGLFELQTWFEDIGEYLVQCARDLMVAVNGKLGFLEDSITTIGGLRPATTRLAQCIKDVRSRLEYKAVLSVSLELPIDEIHSRWLKPTFRLGDVDSASKEVDSCIARRKQWLSQNNFGAWTGTSNVMSPEKAARRLRQEDVTAERVKWFLRKLSV